MKDKIQLSYRNSSMIGDQVFIDYSKKLNSYISYLHDFVSNINYEEKEASLNLVNDQSICEQVLKLAKEISSPKLKYVIVVGIGGSNLGAMAIYNALSRNMPAFSFDKPKIIFLDTNNFKLILNTIEVLKKEVSSPEEIVLNIISKSGGTTETLVNFEIIYEALVTQFNIKREVLASRVVATTDENSKLWIVAEKSNFKKISIPKKVGGRFSVLSAVGLLPLALVGIDIEELVFGAKDMLDKCVLNDVEKNPSLVSAISLYLHNKEGKNIVNTFIFNSELEALGKWYSQLVGESIGKEYDKDGKLVNIGITPIVSVGSTDLHSVAQLFLGGPKDKFTFFLHSLENTGIIVPKDLVSLDINPIIAEKDLNEIMRAIINGTEEVYKKQGLPFIDINFSEISAYSIGAFMQLKMVETMLLAHLFNLDAFDQPNVEAYKIETKKILES
jgi:glucose-6-phosphate isomerase